METQTQQAKTFANKEFKSYYVVWKRTVGKYITNLYTGLNRTMQYGNPWVVHAKSMCCTCLNRTMQYGNFPECFQIFQRWWRFKSYYVVWKQI